jgi:hypothetical protein
MILRKGGGSHQREKLRRAGMGGKTTDARGTATAAD